MSVLLAFNWDRQNGTRCWVNIVGKDAQVTHILCATLKNQGWSKKEIADVFSINNSPKVFASKQGTGLLQNTVCLGEKAIWGLKAAAFDAATSCGYDLKERYMDETDEVYVLLKKPEP